MRVLSGVGLWPTGVVFMGVILALFEVGLGGIGGFGWGNWAFRHRGLRE